MGTDSSGVIHQQAEIIRDNSEKLEEQNQLLKELNEEKNKVISIVSHDLKSPLNRVFALTNLIKMTGNGLSEDQAEYLDKIQMVAVEGLGLIRNMLDINLIENNKVELYIEEIDLLGLLQSLVNEHRLISEKKGIEIKILTQKDIYLMKTDRQYVKRIFENLLSNAIKYTRLDGKVEMAISQPSESIIEVSLKDSGYGIMEEDMDKLFKKFSILSSKPTGSESSHGLGLFIVKGLVDSLNGKVWCESTDGHGSTFTVQLPIQHSS